MLYAKNTEVSHSTQANQNDNLYENWLPIVRGEADVWADSLASQYTLRPFQCITQPGRSGAVPTPKNWDQNIRFLDPA